MTSSHHLNKQSNAPAPPPHRQSWATVDVDPIETPGCGLPIFETTALFRRLFQSLWHRLSSGRPIFLGLRDVDFEFELDRGVLVFGADHGWPLCLSGQLDGFDESVAFVADELRLSWRLAAVDFIDRLPDHPPSRPGGCGGRRASICTSTPHLRIDPRIPAPADTIAPTDELARVVQCLRAGFFTIEKLTRMCRACTDAIHPFVSALTAAGVARQAPRALSDDRDPFAFLGLHWSAPPSLIHCTYGRLRRRLTASSANDRHTRVRHRLDRAFDVLKNRAARRRLRRSLIAPPVFAEVLDHFRRRLRQTPDDATSRRLALCRRILELAPGDDEAHRVRGELLDPRLHPLTAPEVNPLTR